MKRKRFNKFIILSLLSALLLSGCSKETSNSGEPANDTELAFTIGISQLIQHPALDASKQGFIDEVKALGFNAIIVEENAQGDVANAQMIAEKFVKDKVDLVFTIATITSQAAKKSLEDTGIPLVFTAVTDPVYSQLVTDMNVTDKNITGVIDAAPIEEDLQMFMDLKKDIKKVGIIYNIGESNSEVQVEKTKEFASKLGLTIETVGIASVNDIPQAVDTISKKAEGLYIITDNMVASSIGLVAKLAEEKGLLSVSADGTHVEEGIMVSKGVSYYEIGKQSAQIAKQILVDKVDVSKIPVQTLPEYEKKVNMKVAKALGFEKDSKAFAGAIFIEE